MASAHTHQVAGSFGHFNDGLYCSCGHTMREPSPASEKPTDALAKRVRGLEENLEACKKSRVNDRTPHTPTQILASLDRRTSTACFMGLRESALDLSVLKSLSIPACRGDITWSQVECQRLHRSLETLIPDRLRHCCSVPTLLEDKPDFLLYTCNNHHNSDAYIGAALEISMGKKYPSLSDDVEHNTSARVYAEHLLRMNPFRTFALSVLLNPREVVFYCATRSSVGDPCEFMREGPMPMELALPKLHYFFNASPTELGITVPAPVPNGSMVVVGALGEGATSHTFKVRHSSSDCVLKLFRQEFAERCHFEAIALHQLSRVDNVPRLVQECDHPPSLVVTPVGEKPGCLTVEDFRTLAITLAAAHSAGRVHRDIHLGNIYRQCSGIILLNDWGCSVTVNNFHRVAGTLISASDDVLRDASCRSLHLYTSADDFISLWRFALLYLNDSQLLRTRLSGVTVSDPNQILAFWSAFPAYLPAAGVSPTSLSQFIAYAGEFLS
eukprot:gnl/Spiro4/23292_TR11514_c0_g1_i1.p1 gnl/Spiro4/23292_TR11514_c0_g1~~gnl/Spiro4/23292_TR11514_c0_g1_i1.p1  ORF type:complete len:508 (-),score=22.63 gnl/Spiro4/23292_TR11514_c0_g1_i1:88-1581(-)